ncbi:glycosyltransferase family 2 protein [Propioniciclava sinopodophylli]|uniref:glycosyltransferase family 2 protein n=1 Tax=Propioniciclava sinopodophylli TaxID=1837344 RepID=UPI002491F27D|nr:glycosyltransferase family 2 protein [Propioniciclava sinopodophylli]
MNELISVVVPVYNVDPYLRQCLDSLVQQEYDTLEIILVDDGSTDRSPEICAEYAALDSRVFLLTQANGGLSAARNAGVAKCTGDLIAFIDSDDWVSVEYFGVLVEALRACGADVAMCATSQTFGETPVLPDSRPESVCISGREVLERPNQLYPIDAVSAWGKLIRREVFGDLAFPVGRLHEDAHVSSRLFSVARSVALVDRPMYFYRQREGSITWGSWSLRSRVDKARALIDRAEFLESIGVDGRASADLIRGISVHALARSAALWAPGEQGAQLQLELSDQRRIILDLRKRIELPRKLELFLALFSVLPWPAAVLYSAIQRRNARSELDSR